VRVLTLPWLFRLPRMRRYDGYALPWTILLRGRDASDDLICHELCHVWQMQHHPLRVFWAWLTEEYETAWHEVEARRAVALTR
jgi:predicted metal-dependent hydrolase